MPDLSAAWTLSVLGPIFLALGGWRAVRHGPAHPQARSWLILGALFSAVAVWLHTATPA